MRSNEETVNLLEEGNDEERKKGVGEEEKSRWGGGQERENW